MEMVRLNIFLSIAPLPGKIKPQKHKKHKIKLMQETLSGKQNIVILVLLGFCCLRHHKQEIPWHCVKNWLEWTTGSVVVHEKWRHIINYLLTSLARDRTGEYWPSVVFVRTLLRSVRTATTSGQYSPVQPLRLGSKRLLLLLRENCH